jgi:hypothetical protein
MNKIRIRVVLCVDKVNRIQVSTDNMVWFTIAKGMSGADALVIANELYVLASKDDSIPTHILWKNK